MTKDEEGTKPVVVLCEGRSGQSFGRALEKDLLVGLARWPEVEVAVLPHLYDLAPDGPAVQWLRSVPGHMIVLAAMYPRAAFWVLDANGVKGRMGRTSLFPKEEMEPPGADPSARTIWCLDLRPHGDAQPYLREIERILTQTAGRPIEPSLAEPTAADDRQRRVAETTRPRWYPVVDYARCRACLECLNFCLFGVYGLDEAGGLLVEQPDACRDGCPACARVCPSGAIMFPGHSNPAVAGDPTASVTGTDLGLVQLSGQPTAPQQAAAERQRALDEKAAQDKSSANDALDRLVDDVDGMEL